MSLITSCDNTNQKSLGANPLLEQWDTPFGVPPFDKISHKHFMPAFEDAFAKQNEAIKRIEQDEEEPTFLNTILPFDNSDIELFDLYKLFVMIQSADSTPAIERVNTELMPRITAHKDQITLNGTLFARIQVVYNTRKESNLSAQQIRLVERIYDKFKRGGALLDESHRDRFTQINTRISELEVKFSQNVLAENNNYELKLSRKDIEHLPYKLKSMLNKHKGDQEWGATLHPSMWIPFLTYQQSRELREKLYTAYLSRGANDNEFNNEKIIHEILQLRLEKAQMLGYKSYSELVISVQMASTPEAAYELLEQIWTPALERAKGELLEMETLFKEEHPNETFASWDWWYYAEKLRQKNYALNEEALRDYFPIDAVRNGMFLLANRLFGLTIRPISIPLPFDNAEAYEVTDRDNSHVGVLYIDPYTRPGKGQGAWCDNLREQRYKDGERVTPVAIITCNITQSNTSIPTLLSPIEVETLFHEFGHALHFLLQDVEYRGLSEVEGDFVELPSQIMENWAFEPALLRQYAVHHRNSNVIPEELIEKLHKSRLFNQGFLTTEITAAALLDLDVHSLESIDGFSVSDFESVSLRQKRGLIPQIEPRYHLSYFSHLFTFDYASGYYFYLWAEVLDKDAFAAFTQSGDIFNTNIAQRFRREILERGGSEDGMTMYHKFRGDKPSRMPLLMSRGLAEPPKPDIQYHY